MIGPEWTPSGNSPPLAPGPLPVISHGLRADGAHYSPGRQGHTIRYLVLHNTQGHDSRGWLSTTPGSAVSVHALIQDAKRYNLVDYADSAWHVGIARPPYTNANCLGVELESANTGGPHDVPYTDGTYNTLAHLLATWLFSYGLDWATAVVCHRDIALPPGRRTDPCSLDLLRTERATAAWLLFLRALPAAELARWCR